MAGKGHAAVSEGCVGPTRSCVGAACIILALLGTLVARLMVDHANRIAARNMATQLRMALKHHQQEYGNWPAGDEAQMTATLRGSNPRSIVFFESKVPVSERGEFLDPWKVPYRLGVTNEGIAWAYSCGPNKRDEGGVPGSDDIVSGR